MHGHVTEEAIHVKLIEPGSDQEQSGSIMQVKLATGSCPEEMTGNCPHKRDIKPFL